MKPCLPGAAVALLTLASFFASAGGIHKAVGPDGVVVFSDQAPDSRAEPQRDIGPSATDPAIERASTLVDVAERAVALARRAVWSDRDAGRIPTPRMTHADAQRIEFYKQEARGARLALCLLLQAKRSAVMREPLTASYVPPAGRP